MNKRGLKNRTTISNAINSTLNEKFCELSLKTRIPKSKLLDEAIEDLLRKYKTILNTK